MENRLPSSRCIFVLPLDSPVLIHGDGDFRHKRASQTIWLAWLADSVFGLLPTPRSLPLSIRQGRAPRGRSPGALPRR
jgi:hypothetical protein